MSIFNSLMMGCVCGKETVNVQNRKFYVKSRLAEGYISAFCRTSSTLISCTVCIFLRNWLVVFRPRLFVRSGRSSLKTGPARPGHVNIGVW